jgi:hypothetical protein
MPYLEPFGKPLNNKTPVVQAPACVEMH